MRLLIQRVKKARVTVGEEVTGEIGKGLLVFLGIHQEDSAQAIPWLVKKLMGLRVFSDEKGKMNLSLKEVKGEVLLVSQFTLYGTCHKGRRPEFTRAAKGELAKELYENFSQQLQEQLPQLQRGRFAASMEVELINDGPITLILDSPQSEN